MAPGFPFDFCPELVSHHERSGVFRFASAAATRVVGRAPEALVGTSIVELACADDRAQVAKAWSAALEAGEARGVRFRVMRDEKRVHVEMSLRVVTEGEAAGTAVCVTRDVEDVVQAERLTRARLAEAELGRAHWEELVAQIPGIVWHAPFREDGSRGSAEFLSDYLERMVGYTPEEWITTPNFWTSIMHPDDVELMAKAVPRSIDDGSPPPAYRVFARSGRVVYFQSYMRVRRDARGAPERLYGLTLDVTTFKETEAENAALLAEVRRAAEEREVLLEQLTQRARDVLALSAPLIPLGEGVVVMPLIGTVDEDRAALVLRNLLEGVAERRARVAILDMTGVPSLDAEGAEGLVQAARGVELLGARVVLTGLRADVARTLVSLGLSLEDVPTRGTVLHALAETGSVRRRG